MKEVRKIEVVPYDPSWPEQFEVEAGLIRDALGDHCIAVHHVGSTAVPGLCAKPKIDIILVSKSPEATIQKLEKIGFKYRGEYNIPMHYGFSKRGERDVNLHVYQERHPEITLNLTFRDYLRSHPEVRDEYGALKLELLKQKSSFEKSEGSMFTGYNLGKDAFISSILKRAGFDSLRFVICTHHNEWKAAKSLRKRYFFDKISIADPYEWTFNHPDHLHFILYKGVEIIGYCHIQLWPQSRAAIRIIVMEEAYRNQGFAKQFLEWIETYLKAKNYKSIHTESSPDAVGFYQCLGYIDMPFNDPDGHEGGVDDIPMGKSLL
ncbi:GNAT family N-acetyltransferase [Simkania negevensis]|uniref:UPF0157 protein BH1888 n=1 Tax=Simkania negevensis (strain ATCC VR-1471 / DSM 27360 / Z) TaxID=331113 RepID=F8L5H4_SIMNZ|nr:GNAT family N-acetyltransferase [Simkania negevensis]MCB1075556.1 GNAT family N-acetyltransferase [Simkania sp.]CCB89430.1 UPF0157 protein BH1888 [Simkania negevensis Z]